MGTIAVIGAGISGLVAARKLQSHGHDVTVYEKSRSLGGRCATRKWSGHIVDHGAQYFTISSELFRQELDILPEKSLMRITTDVVTDSGEVLPATGGVRYFYSPGNNRMGNVLVSGLDVRLEQVIERISPEGRYWNISSQTYDAVVITAPWPQAASILGLPDWNSEYVPCLTVFFEFEGKPPGKSRDVYAISIRDPDESLAWSACENHKFGRVSGNKTVFVVQASKAFSYERLEDSPAAYTPELLARLQQLWGITAPPTATFNHRWRFARRRDPIPFPELKPGLFMAGDSRVESKIESVWLDGMRAAQEVNAYLKSR